MRMKAKAATEVVEGKAMRALKAEAATEVVKGKAMKALRAKAAAEVVKGTGQEGHDGQGTLTLRRAGPGWP